MKTPIILLTILVFSLTEHVSGQPEWARVPSPLDTLNGYYSYNLRINKHGDLYVFIKSAQTDILLRKNGVWQKLNIPDSIALNSSILFDTSGAAWFMDLKTNLYRHDGTNLTAFINPNPLNDYTGFGKLSMAPDQSIWGLYYLLDTLTMDNTTYFVHFSNGAWTEFNLVNANIPLQRINLIQADSNRLWMSAYYSYHSDTLFYYLQSGLVYPVTRLDVGAQPQSQTNNFDINTIILDENGWLNMICEDNYKAHDFIFDGSAWHERDLYIPPGANNSINNFHLDSLNRMIFDISDGMYRSLFINNLPVGFDGFSPHSNSGFPLGNYIAWDMDQEDRIWAIEDIITPILYRFDPNGFNQVSGQVFYDLNNDGMLNTNEPGIPDQLLTISPGPLYNFTRQEGYAINLFDTSGNYSISVATPPYWQITTVPPVQNFSQSAPFEITDSVNFGFYPTQFIQDLELTGCLHGTRPGGTGQQWILWKNNGTTLAGPDTLTLTLDSNLHFTGSNPSPAIVNGPVIQWVYPVLTPFATGRIELHYTVDSLAVIGDSVLNSIEIAPVGTDATPGNNVVEVSDIIRGSFDPNEKSVTPAGTGIQGYISPFEELTYTIYFQNTGNDTALNITLFDLLNENLDISTLKFNGSSHACNWFLDFNRQLIFRFPAINLPDSSTNEVMSHGFVSFSIRPKPGLPDQTVITNSAGIVFDFNAPILTNQVINTIQLILGEEQTTPDRNGIRVYPNPAGDNLWIHWNAADPVFRLKLMEMTGKVLIQEEVCRNSCRLETGSLAPGVYMIMAWNGRQVDYTRFVKQ